MLVFLRIFDLTVSALQALIFFWAILSWILFFTRDGSFRWRHRSLYTGMEQLYVGLSRLFLPLLRPFRRILPPSSTGGIDWSPLLLLMFIWLLQVIVKRIVFGLA